MRILSCIVGTLALIICWLIATGYVVISLISETTAGTCGQIRKLWLGK